MAYEFITSTGVIVADTSDILLATQTEYKSVFGTDLIVSPDTPQGVLITAESLSRAEVVNNNAALANQINPNVAGGVYLDAIMALLGTQRVAATKTLVENVALTGVAGTIIPEGTQARTGDGDIFETLAQVVLAGDGTITVDFASVEYGPISCPMNTLVQVVSNVLGWETVNNPTAGILGQDVQSDQAARAYRNNILAFQAVSLAEAITSALWYVDGVTGLAFRENIAATTQVIDGITMVAHSVWACVNGGADLDIAAALLENKSSGAAWNGSEDVEIIEPASGQSYTVKFDRPDEIPVIIEVTTTNGSESDIKAAIVDYIAGLVNGMQGFALGADVSPFEISGAVTFNYPTTFISKVRVSYASPVSWTTDTLAIAINEVATADSSSITVIIT